MESNRHNVSRFRDRVPRGARKIVARIRERGGRAYLVGGCLRDLLLGREVRDWDIATDLPPDQLRPLFKRVILVGARFGTIVVPLPDGVYEVTTFRTEGDYSDGRHPDSVAYSRDLVSDLRRRDFTINAMAWDPDCECVEDPFGGLRDLARGVIRAVGDPGERFREDALRLLRAVRQATQLNFRIEDATRAAIEGEAAGIARVSAERIREELNGILLAAQPSRGFLLLHRTGLLQHVLPELEACWGFEQNRYHSYDLFRHAVYAADAAPQSSLIVRLAALLHDIAKPETQEARGDDITYYSHQIIGARKTRRILQRLRYSNDEIERVAHLVRHHMFYYESEWTDSAIRRFVRAVGLDHIPDLIAVRLADMAGNPRKSGDTSPLRELLRRIDEVIAKDTALNVRDLTIGGHDLMALGVPEGPVIGRILRALLDRVLDDPAFNARETLLAEARRMVAAGEHLRPEPAGDDDDRADVTDSARSDV